MPSLRSRSGASAAGSKKARTQKNQTRGILKSSATVNVDGVELNNNTPLDQSTKLNEADTSDDPEVAIEGPELLAKRAAKAGEIVNPPSNKDKLDITNHEMVQNSAAEANGQDTIHNQNSINVGTATDSEMHTTPVDTEDTTCNSQGVGLIRPPPSGPDTAHSNDSIVRAAALETRAPAIKPGKESSSSSQDAEPVRFSSTEEISDIADLEMVHNSVIETNGQAAAHSHSCIARAATLKTRVSAVKPEIEETSYSGGVIDLTSDDGEYEFEDQLSNHETNSLASRSTPADHNPSLQASTIEQGRKRSLSDLSKTDDLSGTSISTAIFIEEDSLRRPRKIHAPRFRDLIDRDNLWMLETRRRIVKAQKFCDEEDKDLDEEQKKLDMRKQRIKGQRGLLERTVGFINSCGAHEQKSSRQLEKGT